MRNKNRKEPKVETETCRKRPNVAQDEDLVPVKQAIYQIRVKGHLGEQWGDWFEGLTLGQEQDGITTLTGPMADQAALHGLLVKLRNLCLPLISVNRVTRPSNDRDQVDKKE
jgi:hypothetical protein